MQFVVQTFVTDTYVNIKRDILLLVQISRDWQKFGLFFIEIKSKPLIFSRIDPHFLGKSNFPRIDPFPFSLENIIDICAVCNPNSQFVEIHRVPFPSRFPSTRIQFSPRWKTLSSLLEEITILRRGRQVFLPEITMCRSMDEKFVKCNNSYILKY